MTTIDKQKYARKLNQLIKKLVRKREQIYKEIAAEEYARRFGHTIESHSEPSTLLGTEHRAIGKEIR